MPCISLEENIVEKRVLKEMHSINEILAKKYFIQLKYLAE